MLDRNQPLGLSKGSVRAALALLSVGAAIFGAFLQLPEPWFTFLTVSAGTITGYYFGHRSKEEKE